METQALSDVVTTPTARPDVSTIHDLDAVAQSIDPATGAIQYTTFYVFANDDVAFFGEIHKPKAEISNQEFADSLERVPDSIIYPVVPGHAEFTVASDDTHARYIKRPNLATYELFNDDDFLAQLLLSEATIMEQLNQNPHPNIVRYHGVRVRRGRVTGFVLDKYEESLLELVRNGVDLDETKVLEGLESAVEHLHSLGLAHNDINPENVMMSQDKTPILIDFGSCQSFGKRVMTQGTQGWADVFDGRSGKEHDIYALTKMREWFENPWF